MNVKFRKLRWLEWWWLGDIYSPNHYSSCCYRWHSGQSGGALDRALFTVRCLLRQQTVGVRRSWPLKSFVLLLHRTVRWHTGHVQCVLTSLLWLLTSALCAFTVHRSWPLAHLTVAPLAHRTCPVHTGHVQWIIAEWLPKKPESGQFVGCSPWAPDSVWCATGSTIASLCSKLGWVTNLIFFLVYIDPYAPEINDN
jgi:hypothetical protein